MRERKMAGNMGHNVDYGGKRVALDTVRGGGGIGGGEEPLAKKTKGVRKGGSAGERWVSTYIKKKKEKKDKKKKNRPAGG